MSTNSSIIFVSGMTDDYIILIIEDSRVNRKILSNLMTDNGYQVWIADSGNAALELLTTQSPDLILLDVMLPVMDGYTLCRQLKHSRQTKGIPVIFISALSETENKLAGFEAGGADYITKPFHHDEVLVRVATQLKMSRLQHQLEEQNKQLDLERQKIESLLCNVLPTKVAQELLKTGSCQPQSFDQVTVSFVDIVSFTTISSELSPEFIIEELNDIFTGFDQISDNNNCERMKTIGDAYLFVCGVPEDNRDHACNVVLAATEMITFLKERNKCTEQQWKVRVGIHSGKVVGGIVGSKKYLYDIFGDTVNLASRLEELSSPMRVNISKTTNTLLQGRFSTTKRRDVDVKGKGLLSTYLVDD